VAPAPAAPPVGADPLGPAPVAVAVSPLELATVAARLGLGPWSVAARRAVGVGDDTTVTAADRVGALVGLVRRGLVAPGVAPGTVEVHPALVAVAGLLDRVSVVVEAPSPEPDRRHVLALVPGVGGLLIDAGCDDLLIAPLDVDVPLDDAAEILGGDGPCPST
jgi:hypothetical protein